MDDRKREMRDKYKASQRAKVRESMPITDEQAQSLFDHLDVALPKAGCDHSRALTDAWAAVNGVDADRLGMWLRSVGGHCDCEVLGNAEQAWLESLRGTDRERN